MQVISGPATGNHNQKSSLKPRPAMRTLPPDDSHFMASMQPTGRALVSHGPYKTGGWKLQNVSLRSLRENELLVEVIASGICQTDLHFAGLESGHGVHYPRVMGHEGILPSPPPGRKDISMI